MFCLTKGPKIKAIKFTIIEHYNNQLKFTFKELKPLKFYLKNENDFIKFLQVILMLIG